MSINTSIKVMYLNPVGTSIYDETFAKMVSTYKYPATAVDVVSLNPATVPPKMTNLEYRAYEALIVADTVKAVRQASRENYDAVVIGCFYDPALADAREISGETIVVAPCQASAGVALKIANNFGIIIGEEKWADQMRETVYAYGYRDKLAAIQSVGLRVEDFHKDPDRTTQLIADAAIRAVDEFKAESIILGCTLEVGFFEELYDILFKLFLTPIPVIDCSIASFKAAENAALLRQIGWTNSRIWGMQHPPEGELIEFGIFQDEYKFGNIIHVPAD